MKILLVGIALAVAMVFTSQAFAAELPDCPNVKWKHGHYVCDEGAKDRGEYRQAAGAVAEA